MQNDDKLEKYLSEFRPRVVRPLMSPKFAAPWLKRLAVAAVLLIGAGIGWRYTRYVHLRSRVGDPLITDTVVQTEAQRPNAFALTRLALTDEAGFEARLASESRAVLPNFRGKSTLRVFSKE